VAVRCRHRKFARFSQQQASSKQSEKQQHIPTITTVSVKVLLSIVINKLIIKQNHTCFVLLLIMALKKRVEGLLS
jgi:hypothetical protein